MQGFDSLRWHMTKDRDQMTPEEPADWSRLQSHRGQGTGGSGLDRLAGEEARPTLHDDDPAAETIPEPQPTEADADTGA